MASPRVAYTMHVSAWPPCDYLLVLTGLIRWMAHKRLTGDVNRWMEENDKCYAIYAQSIKYDLIIYAGRRLGPILYKLRECTFEGFSLSCGHPRVRRTERTGNNRIFHIFRC